MPQTATDASRAGPCPRETRLQALLNHSSRSLFMAFRVHDDFIDDEEEPDGRVFLNDGVELFFDGDRVPNDFPKYCSR